jgi:3-oxoacyl-[acyl-carrier protein] reductase
MGEEQTPHNPTRPGKGILEGKVAIVTGAGRGLGRAIAMALASEGASLVLMSRTLPELEITAKQTNLPEGKLLIISGDVGKYGDIKKMTKTALSKFGRIDVLVNNAGTLGPVSPASKVKIKDWKKCIQTNVIGTFLCARAVLPIFVRNKHGKIINITGAGDTALENFSAYTTSKSAIIRFTETLAAEVKRHGVCVNAVAPGGISTKMTEEIFNAGDIAGKSEHERTERILASKGVPLELPASLVVFLASEESHGLTGKIISAVHDDWKEFGAAADRLNDSDLYTMKRVYPNFTERLKLPKEGKN